MSKPLFDLGQIVATPAAIDALPSLYLLPRILELHQCGDWGDVCDEDKQANEDALRSGARLLSAYTLDNGVRVWVITEAVGDDGKRAATTILLPEEY